MAPSARVWHVLNQLGETPGEEAERDTITVTDNRTGDTVEIPISDNAIKAKALSKLKLPGACIGLRSYDPGFTNTSAATSRITFINGPEGILTYRGYPIEQLAEKSSFLEVSYLLMYGELPTVSQLQYFEDRVMKHTFIHEDMVDMLKSFRYDAHPMGMLATMFAAMGTQHPEANPALQGQAIYSDITLRNKQIHRILGSIPTMAAFAYRRRIGRPIVYPSHQKMTYSENFLYMLDMLSNKNYRPHPELAKALDVLFIIHADHELNCSTSAMRHLASSGVDVYTCVSAATGALYGPRHGGANEAVLRMLVDIGGKENIPTFLERVKKREVRLMGFGHRVYKNYDPRARIVRKIAERVFDILGREPLIEVAEALEAAALRDPYFKKRKLYPNVDFYSGLIYKAMGFPTDFFPVLFAIPRAVGWLSHWNEFLDDPENRIVRPRQVYKGHQTRDYVNIDNRKSSSMATNGIVSNYSSESRRRYAAGVTP
jgi:citrate synthase